MSHDIQGRESQSVAVKSARATVSVCDAALEFKMKPSTFVMRLVKPGLVKVRVIGRARLIDREEWERALSDPRVLQLKREVVRGSLPLTTAVIRLKMGAPTLAKLVTGNGIPSTRRGRLWLPEPEVRAIEEVRELFPRENRARTIDRYTAVRLIGSELSLREHLQAGHLEKPDTELKTERFNLFAVLLVRARRERKLIPWFDREISERDAVPKEFLPKLVRDPDRGLEVFEASRRTITISEIADRLGCTIGRAKTELIETGIIPSNKLGLGARVFEDTFVALLESGALDAFRFRLPEGYIPVNQLEHQAPTMVETLIPMFDSHGIPFLRWGTYAIERSQADAILKAIVFFGKRSRLRTISALTAESIVGSAEALDLHVKAGHLPSPVQTNTGPRYSAFSITLLRFRREAGVVPVLGESVNPKSLVSEENLRALIETGDSALRSARPRITLRAAAKRLGLTSARFRREVIQTGRLRIVKGDAVFEDEFEAYLLTAHARDLTEIGPPNHTALGKLAGALGMNYRAMRRIVSLNHLPHVAWGNWWIADTECAAIREAIRYYGSTTRRRVIGRGAAVAIIGSARALDEHVVAGEVASPENADERRRYELFSVFLLRIRRDLGVVPKRDEPNSTLTALPLTAIKEQYLGWPVERVSRNLSLEETAEKLALPLDRLRQLLEERALSTSVVTPEVFRALRAVARHFHRLADSWERRVEVLRAANLIGSQSSVGLYEEAGYLSATNHPRRGELFLYRSLIYIRAARRFGAIPLLERGDGSTISLEKALEMLDVPYRVLEAWTKSNVFTKTGDDARPYFLREVEYQKANL